MVRLVVAHTGQLDRADLIDARSLLAGAFGGELTDNDWEHCLGGAHALLWDGAELVGHAALVTRRLLHAGRVLRTGYVEGVGVRADVRRRGHGGTLMAALEAVADGAHEVAALAATDEGVAFYRRRGWLPWQGPTSVLSPGGLVRTQEDDDCVHVLPLRFSLDRAAPLTCDWRDGDPW